MHKNNHGRILAEIDPAVIENIKNKMRDKIQKKVDETNKKLNRIH